jgi:hypothetical protein
MEKIVKQQILQDINDLEVSDLLELINADDIRLEEMVDAGLERNKLKALQVEINGRMADPEVEDVKEDEIISICKGIEKDEYDVLEIRSFLLNKIVTPEDLRKYTSMSDEIIEKIQYYQKKEINIPNIEGDPPYLPNRTDVFFLGQPGSGKSCVLGALFHHFYHTGILVEDLDHKVGTLYRNHLKNEFSYGILPNSNAVDDLYPMPFEIRNLKDNSKRHPLNFIDMSGEVFDDIYEMGIDAIKPKFRNYIKNKNRKILFFIIDYDLHKKSRKMSLGIDQGSKALAVLETLDNMGTLDKVDAVYLLVTKSDLFPKEKSKIEYTQEFIDVHLKSLINTLKDKKDKYEHRNKFSITVFPFSIGVVKFKGLLTSIDNSGVTYVTDAIQKYSFIKRSNTLLDKIVGRR